MQPFRIVRAVLIGQGVLLGLLAAAGLVAAAGSDGTALVLGFRLGVLHSSVLLAVAVGGIAAAVRPLATRVFVPVQMAGFALLFVIGSAVAAGQPRGTVLSLNWADHFLHLGLAIIGLTLGMLLASPWAAGEHDFGQD